MLAVSGDCVLGLKVTLKPANGARRGSRLQLLRSCLLRAALFPARAADAADADNGKRLAETRCAPCHAVAPNLRREVADAPPFEVIARRFATRPEVLAFSLLDPHPRMNVSLTRREVEDVAAYINTLAK